MPYTYIHHRPNTCTTVTIVLSIIFGVSIIPATALGVISFSSSAHTANQEVLVKIRKDSTSSENIKFEKTDKVYFIETSEETTAEKCKVHPPVDVPLMDVVVGSDETPVTATVTIKKEDFTDGKIYKLCYVKSDEAAYQKAKELWDKGIDTGDVSSLKVYDASSYSLVGESSAVDKKPVSFTTSTVFKLIFSEEELSTTSVESLPVIQLQNTETGLSSGGVGKTHQTGEKDEDQTLHDKQSPQEITQVENGQQQTQKEEGKKETSTLDSNSSPNGRHTTEVDTAQRTSPHTSDKDVQLNPNSPEGDQVQKEGEKKKNEELSGTVDHSNRAETKNTHPQDISLPKAQNGHGLQTGDEAQGKGPKPNAINTPKVTDGRNSPDVSTAAGVAGAKQVTQETQEKRAEEKSVQSPATGTAASNPDTSTDRGTVQTPDATPKEAAIHLIPVTPLGGQKGEGKPTDSANTRAIGTDNKGKDTTVHVKGTKAKGDTTEKGDGTKGTSQTHVVPTDGTSTGKNPSAPKTDALTNKGDRPATVGRVPPKVSVTVPPMPDVNKTTILSATAISSTTPAVLITSVVFLYLYNW